MLSTTEEVKSKIDIVDLINEYTPLKQSGVNFKALCPFHNEKTPSFMVSREKQFFKCFGCGESGDIFSFLQKQENIDFPEALQILAERAGVKINRSDAKLSSLKTRLYDLHSDLTSFYHDHLFSERGKPALEYLIKNRGLSEQTIKEFKVGYAPNSWDSSLKFLKSKNYSDYEIAASGTVVEKDSNYSKQTSKFYDRFRNRIIFPIEDHLGKTVGFTARALDPNENAKYINSPQTIIYNKSQVLFGFSKAKKYLKANEPLVLVEGALDVVVSNQAGVKNVAAPLGTALTQEQITIIKRTTNQVATCFDNDLAGLTAAKRGIELLWQHDMDVKVVILPAGVKDPGELGIKNPNLWQQSVINSQNFMDYFFDKEAVDKNLSVIDDKRALARSLLPWIAKLTDPIAKDHYLKLLAEKIDVAEETLRQSLNKYAPTKSAAIETRTTTNKPATAKQDRLNLTQQRLLALILYFPYLIKKAAACLTEDFFIGDAQLFYKTLIIYYTKHNTISSELIRQELESSQPQLVSFFNSLGLLASSEFADLTEKEIYIEYELAINFLKQNYLFSQKKILKQKINQAESQGNVALANQLLNEFNQLK